MLEGNLVVVLKVTCSTDRSGLLHWWTHLVGNAGAVPLLVVDPGHVANDLVSFACVIALLANVLLDRSELAILVCLVIYEDGNLGIGALLSYVESGLIELSDVDLEFKHLRHSVVLFGLLKREFRNDCRPGSGIVDEERVEGSGKLGGVGITVDDYMEGLQAGEKAKKVPSI